MRRLPDPRDLEVGISDVAATAALRSAVATRRRQLEIRSAGVLTTVGLCLAVAAAWIAHTGTTPDNTLYALGLALAVAVPVGVGLFAWDDIHARFARALVGVGLYSFVPALSSSSNALLYSVGRVGEWFVIVAVVWLVLAFPTGRLAGRADRGLVAATAALVVLLYVPTALVVDAFPVPAPWTACVDNCPANAFMLTASQLGFVDSVAIPLREALTFAAFVGTAIVLSARIRGATRLTRRTLSPVLVTSICATAALALGLVLRRRDPTSPFTEAIAGLIVLWVPLVSIGSLLGVVRWRLYVADALQRLSLAVRASAPPHELEALAAAVLDDPTARLAHRGGDGTWRDTSGAPVRLGTGRQLTEVRDDGRALGAVVHDAALVIERPFIEAVATYAVIGEENHRMAAELEASLRELDETRARQVAAADAERRRIKRDLHDGAQQRLVALGIRLALADELLDSDPVRAREMIQALQQDIGDTVDEVRSLAAGIYPSTLAEFGLADALRALGARAAVPVEISVANPGRLAAGVEAAIYFCCSEALQNAAKHAPDSRVTISLTRSTGLAFKVCDDGPGFDAACADRGQGLANMRERLELVGGTLAIVSAPGKGTCVCGRIARPEPAEGEATLPGAVRTDAR